MKRVLIAFNIIFVLIIISGYFYYQNKLDVMNATVAEIDGKEIKESDFINELKRVYGHQVLDEMVNRQVIYTAAQKYNITAETKEIERQYNYYSKDYDSEEDFIEFLELQMGLTKIQFLKDIEYNILLEKIATNDVEISDSELRAYFENNREKYREPEKYHLEQIVVNTKEEAEEILEELKNGSDFNTLAKERSTDVFSLSTGGDLGYVSINDPTIATEIINKASTMDIQSIAIVEIPDGYAIIRLVSSKGAIEYEFDEMKEEIRRELALTQAPSFSKVLEQVKKSLNVKIYE